MMTHEQLQQIRSALVLAFNTSYSEHNSEIFAQSIAILDAALAAPEQDPVAYMLGDDDFADARCYEPREGDIPLYTHPMPEPAAPEPQPVATDCTRIMREQGKPYPRTCPRCGFGPCVYSSTIVIAASAPAPQREWHSLTPDEINNCAGAEIYPSTWAMAFAIGIEQTLRRKNT